MMVIVIVNDGDLRLYGPLQWLCKHSLGYLLAWFTGRGRILSTNSLGGLSRHTFHPYAESVALRGNVASFGTGNVHNLGVPARQRELSSWLVANSALAITP